MREKSSTPILNVRGLNVYYGQSHALQGVDLTLDSGVLSVVGRNGMGKTTLCKTIMGLEKASSGTIDFAGQTLNGRSSSDIARMGIGYVPQGRRLWKSLTVDEHLRLVEKKSGAWTVERVYSVFPRLAERRNNGGAALSGGEQQMVAIGRALLLNPRLLVMDEPTEGLAPVIVSQVADMLIRLGQEGDIDVLVIEQNIGVACGIANKVAIMVNGRINRVMDAAILATDKDLQQALLGVGRHARDESAEETERDESAKTDTGTERKVHRIYISNPKPPNRWSDPVPARQIAESAVTFTPPTVHELAEAEANKALAARNTGIVFVCGALNTRRAEIEFLRDRIKARGMRTQIVDLSTSEQRFGGDIANGAVALHHPRGAVAVFTGNRATATAGMGVAFARWVRQRKDIAGLIGIGGARGAAVLVEGFSAAPLGIPKVVASSQIAGQAAQNIDTTDITVMHSVVDIAGLHEITRDVLGNAAGAMIGMVETRRAYHKIPDDLTTVGLSMSDWTAECAQGIAHQLQGKYQSIFFQANGTGNRCMEILIAAHGIQTILDLSTGDIADLIAGGAYPARPDRLDAVIKAGIPYVGAAGALDIIRFPAPDAVPAAYRNRKHVEEGEQPTAVRTTPDECRKIGHFIGEKLNQMRAPVRFFLPEGGLSSLDAPGHPFHDPEANEALFKALQDTVHHTANRQLVRVPHHINDPEFVKLLANTFTSFNSTDTAAPRRA